VQYSSQEFLFGRRTFGALKEHIDEVSGVGVGCPSRCLCWKLRFMGDPQWHVGNDPSIVET